MSLLRYKDPLIYQYAISVCFFSEHDITRPETFKILSGEPFIKFSRPLINVNMTSKRRVNVDSCLSGSGQAVTTNYADKYWTKKNDENYIKACEKFKENPSLFPLGDPAQVSLYNYAAFFEKNWKYRGTMKIVIPTPQASYDHDIVGKKQYLI